MGGQRIMSLVAIHLQLKKGHGELKVKQRFFTFFATAKGNKVYS